MCPTKCRFPLRFLWLRILFLLFRLTTPILECLELPMLLLLTLGRRTPGTRIGTLRLRFFLPPKWTALLRPSWFSLSNKPWKMATTSPTKPTSQLKSSLPLPTTSNSSRSTSRKALSVRGKKYCSSIAILLWTISSNLVKLSRLVRSSRVFKKNLLLPSTMWRLTAGT